MFCMNRTHRQWAGRCPATISTTVRKLLHHKWLQNALAIVFWLCVWQAVSMAVASSLILASPLTVLKTLAGLVPTAAFWHTV